MSENQQPLDEEQAVSDVQEQENLPAAAEDTLPAAQDENAPAILDAEPEEEEDIDPADVKIFGMKRHVFQLTCLGAAVGYILCGLVGILGEKMQGTGLGDILAKSPSATVWAVAVAAVGYFIGSRLEKKREAAREAEQAQTVQTGRADPFSCGAGSFRVSMLRCLHGGRRAAPRVLPCRASFPGGYTADARADRPSGFPP